MIEAKNPFIKLKESIDRNDYEEIKNLQKICLEEDNIKLKLELDYKIARSELKTSSLNNINEFMYYDRNKLIGYIGVCDSQRDEIEISGMVSPEYRRNGVFKKLFSFVKDEWKKRNVSKILLLSDNKSFSGLEFIKSTGAMYGNSEYEMFLRNKPTKNLIERKVVLRKAKNIDAKEIAKQNSIYFDMKLNEEDVSIPDEEEKCGLICYIAEVNNIIIGKVNISITNSIGGIYGLGVLPKYRKKGYGREILILSIEKLKEKDTKDIMLQVSVKNKNALNLYKSCGFKEVSTMDYYEIIK